MATSSIWYAESHVYIKCQVVCNRLWIYILYSLTPTHIRTQISAFNSVFVYVVKTTAYYFWQDVYNYILSSCSKDSVIIMSSCSEDSIIIIPSSPNTKKWQCHTMSPPPYHSNSSDYCSTPAAEPQRWSIFLDRGGECLTHIFMYFQKKKTALWLSIIFF